MKIGIAIARSMNGTGVLRPLMLMIAAAISSANVHAQAHAAAPAQQVLTRLADPAARSGQSAGLDQWLRRLPGRYTVDGSMMYPYFAGMLNGRPQKEYESMVYKGKADCTSVGVGPGVQCVLDVDWPTRTPRGMSVPASPYSPAMILYGIDPGAAGISYLQVNNKGIAEGSVGPLEMDTVKFITPCANANPKCRRVVKFRAEQDGTVEILLNTWGDYFTELDPTVMLTFRLRRQ